MFVDDEKTFGYIFYHMKEFSSFCLICGTSLSFYHKYWCMKVDLFYDSKENSTKFRLIEELEVQGFTIPKRIHI